MIGRCQSSYIETRKAAFCLFIYLLIKLRHLQQTSGRVTTTVYTNYCGPF